MEWIYSLAFFTVPHMAQNLNLHLLLAYEQSAHSHLCLLPHIPQKGQSPPLSFSPHVHVQGAVLKTMGGGSGVVVVEVTSDVGAAVGVSVVVSVDAEVVEASGSICSSSKLTNDARGVFFFVW